MIGNRDRNIVAFVGETCHSGSLNSQIHQFIQRPRFAGYMMPLRWPTVMHLYHGPMQHPRLPATTVALSIESRICYSIRRQGRLNASFLDHGPCEGCISRNVRLQYWPRFGTLACIDCCTASQTTVHPATQDPVLSHSVAHDRFCGGSTSP